MNTRAARLTLKSHQDYQPKSSQTPPRKTRREQPETRLKTSSMKKGTKLTSNQKKEAAQVPEADKPVSKKLFQKKTRKIAKRDKTPKDNVGATYRQFYKFHFDRLKEDHPNWDTKQITKVTSLLWKKHKSSLINVSPIDVVQMYETVLSGKQQFKTEKLKEGTNEEELEELWRRLPMETKRKWEAKTSAHFEKPKTTKKESFNLRGSTTKKTNSLSFIRDK